MAAALLYSKQVLSELWASKARSDVVVVFTTQPKEAKQAVLALKAAQQQHAGQSHPHPQQQQQPETGQDQQPKQRGRGKSERQQAQEQQQQQKEPPPAESIAARTRRGVKRGREDDAAGTSGADAASLIAAAGPNAKRGSNGGNGSAGPVAAAPAAAASPRAPCAASPAWPEDAVVLEGHVMHLCVCSELFKLQLLGTEHMQADHDLQFTASDGRQREVVVVGLEQHQSELLQAAEPLLRLMYGQEADWAAQPELLLQVCMLADCVQAHACMEACGAALSKLPMSSLPLTFINKVLLVLDSTALGSSLPALGPFRGTCSSHLQQRFTVTGPPAAGSLSQPLLSELQSLPEQVHHTIAAQVLQLQSKGALPDSDAMKALVSTCTASVVTAFTDVAAVANDPQLLQQFTQLPFGAIKVWAASDDLAADSENSMVWLLQAWYKANPRTTLDQMKQLAAQVRVSQCSPVYRTTVLPHLAWFQPKQGLSIVSIMLQSMADNDGDKREQCARSIGETDCPPAWLSTRVRCAGGRHEDGREVAGSTGPELVVTEKQLADVMQAAQTSGKKQRVSGPSRIIKGFELWVEVSAYPSEQAPGKVAVALFMYHGTSKSGLWPPCPCAPVAALLRCARAGKRARERPVCWMAVKLGDGRGLKDFWKLGPISDASALRPYLVGGQLHVSAKVQSVDGMPL